MKEDFIREETKVKEVKIVEPSYTLMSYFNCIDSVKELEMLRRITE